MNTASPLAITPTWRQVTPGLAAELTELWVRSGAIPDAAKAAARAAQAVCVARDADGALCGVGTAVLRVLPRLRQPLYYYRQFFTAQFRGQKQAIPFYNEARAVLQAYNASLARPESLGVLLELENPQLAAHYTQAYVPSAESVFIGYSPRGLQLRVSYFEGATLLPPVLPVRRIAPAARSN